MRGEISNHKVVQGVQTSFGHEFSKIAQKTKKGENKLVKICLQSISD